MKALTRVKKILDSKKAGIVCLLIAILNKSIIALLFSSLKGDKALYLLFTKTFLQTGMLAEKVNVVENGTSVYIYDPAIHSPLYSFLCAPFLWVTQSYFITQLIVSCLGWIFFFSGLYKLASLIFKRQWIVNLFILLCGFFIYPHELSSAVKDTLAMGFTIWSIVLVYKFITRIPNWKTTILLAVALSCLALIKLLYVPLACLFLGILFLVLFLHKKKSHLAQMALLLALLFITGTIVSTCIFKPAYALAAESVVTLPMNSTQEQKGFYPQNLRYTFPFISSSIISTHFWAVQTQRLTGFSYGEAMRLFFRLDVVTFIALLTLCGIFLKKIIANKLLLLLLLSSLTMVGVVTYLSVHEKVLVYHGSHGAWTYVAEARSFLIAMLSLQLVAVGFVFQSKSLRLFRYTLLCLLLFTSVHGIYFSVKNSRLYIASIDTEKNNDGVAQIVTFLKKENATHNKLTLITNDKALRRYAEVQGLQAFAFTNLSPDFSWMKKKEQFLIATYAGDSVFLKKLPAEQLIFLDTIKPFVLYKFTAK